MPVSDVEQRVAPLVAPPGLTLSPIDLGQPMCGARMKGFPLLHLLDAMESTRKDLAQAWRATVPEALRGQTERRAITSVSWLPIEFYFHGVAFFSRELHGEGAAHATRIGHRMAAADINAFFRAVLSIASPTTVLGLSGRFWRSYFEVSTLTVVSKGENQCVAEIKNWPLNDQVSPHEMAGSLVAWMEASRARDVRLTRFEMLAPGHFVLGCSWI